jgi:hypothetical protein
MNHQKCGRTGFFADSSRRSSLRRFDLIVHQHRGDRVGILQALAAERVILRLKKVCYVSPHGRVACIDARDILNREVPQPADRTVLKMTLNDLLDVLGAPAGADVLTEYGSSSMSSITHLVPLAVDVGSVPAQKPGRGGVKGVIPNIGAAGGTRQQNAQAWLLSGSQAQTATSACCDAQMGSIRGNLGAFTPRDSGYREAANNAASVMDAAVQSCRDTGNSMIATPGSESSQTPPVNVSTDQSSGNQNGNTDANSDQSDNTNSGDQSTGRRGLLS